MEGSLGQRRFPRKVFEHSINRPHTKSEIRLIDRSYRDKVHTSNNPTSSDEPHNFKAWSKPESSRFIAAFTVFSVEFVDCRSDAGCALNPGIR